ncbi:hypothetical protein C8R44DRAFT_226270 [Mycena epipterygia]|nr:hypothetical protein C8R44DRAFT_226270 [Mycena epipterygia]
MVLTRRAYKSIIRWLPNELLSEAMSYVSRPALVALCRTSRLTSSLAIPLLYRDVSLSTLPALESFLSTLKIHAELPLPRANYVRKFSINALRVELPRHLVEDITFVLANLLNIEFLELLSVDVHILDMLRLAYFSNLSIFHCSVSPDASVLLPAFINRHQTITHLHLYRSEFSNPYHLDPIHLPNLIHYAAPSSFVPSLVSDTRSVRNMQITWFHDDPDVEAALATFARMAAPRPNLVVRSDHIIEPFFLEHLAASIPHIFILMLGKLSTNSGRIPLDHALNIASKLGTLTALNSFTVLGFEDDNETLTESECADIDIRIVEAWGAACKTLVQVNFHGNKYTKTGRVWVLDD